MAPAPMRNPGTLDGAEILDLGRALKRRMVNQRGYVALTAAPGALRIPVVVIAGPRSGPTAWVIAGAHADDHVGDAALARILPALEPTMVSGRLIVTPLVNASASSVEDRQDPGKGIDLEGRRGVGGAIREFVGETLELCDLVVDLTGGGEGLLRAALAVYPKVGGEVEEASAALARSAGFPLIWAAKGGGIKGGLIRVAAQRGRASVGIGVGGEGRVEEAWVANLALALQGVLAKAGVLRAEPRSLPLYRVFGGLTKVAARRGGLWRRAAEPEVTVGSGGLLGRVLDPFGRELEAVESPMEAVVLGIYTRGGVAPGVPVAELGHGVETEGSHRNPS